MTYEAFKTEILERIHTMFPEDTEISVRSVLKNNNTYLDGLTILENGMHISPTLYLQPYFLAYQSGKSMDTILTDLITLYEENKPKEDTPLSFFSDYQQLKGRIAFKIINAEKNQELLKKIPYLSFLDLAIVFYCLLTKDDSSTTSILIHNSHLEYWNISKKELVSQAIVNTPKLLPFSIQTLSELISEHIPDLFDTEASEDPVCMYVLTNSSKLNGAGCMLYPDILNQFAQKISQDLFVLPSSIHEVILLPATTQCDSPEELAALVKDVNRSQVAEDEILSDHVYYFSRKTQKLTLAC